MSTGCHTLKLGGTIYEIQGDELESTWYVNEHTSDKEKITLARTKLSNELQDIVKLKKESLGFWHRHSKNKADI